MRESTNIKAYFSLFGLILALLSPVLVSHLIYNFRGYFHFKTMNTGQLIETPISTENLGIAHQAAEGQWQLLYVKPTLCDRTCEHKMETFKRLHLSLGKEQSRFSIRSITNPLHHLLAPDSTWLISPNGFLVMHYPTPINLKGMREDIRRLLRFAHVR